ncbi:unnamed protein product [Ceutorhynchus assimilis]|uniref:MADF domain-containing protein n=1 Tax=Ceutorhynchus assimilis TaxID=467358 RepID=A0A9N9QAN9_9CUCU|nr:unnamed protein product [Ceutorhynchus assimilis]
MPLNDIAVKSLFKQFSKTGSACKARWNNIRENYRKSLKKTATKGGQASKKLNFINKQRHWDFQKKSFDERDTKANIVFQKDETEEQEDFEEQISEEEITLHDVAYSNFCKRN